MYVLITLDLNDATTKQRQDFNLKLQELKWNKIGKLTTTWKCKFRNGAIRSSVAKAILNDIEEAKKSSSIQEVEYALQMAEEDIFTGKK